MILNIARKELKSLFASPMGWIILALLMMAFGSYYLTGVNNYFEVMSGAIRPAERVGVTIFVGQTVYSIASFIMLFAVPLLTMRLIMVLELVMICVCTSLTALFYPRYLLIVFIDLEFQHTPI